MNNADVKNLIKSVMGWVALALALICVAKLFGWSGAQVLVPGDVVATGIAALALGNARSWF